MNYDHVGCVVTQRLPAERATSVWVCFGKPALGTLLIAWASLSLSSEVATMIGVAVNYKREAADLMYAWRTVGWFMNIGWLVLGIKMVASRKPI